MTDYGFLSTTSVAIILVGVAMLAVLTTLVLGTFGDLERSHKVPTSNCAEISLCEVGCRRARGRAGWPPVPSSSYTVPTGADCLSGSFYNRDEAIGLYQPPHNSL